MIIFTLIFHILKAPLRAYLPFNGDDDDDDGNDDHDADNGVIVM